MSANIPRSRPIVYRNHENQHLVFFSYKKGGVASGMRNVETNAYDVKRLLHVKGKKRVVAKEVSHSAWRLCNRVTVQGKLCWERAPYLNVFQVEMSWKSFNLGDVFLLDIGKTIVQWNGPKSNRQEKLKVRFCDDIRACVCAQMIHNPLINAPKCT